MVYVIVSLFYRTIASLCFRMIIIVLIINLLALVIRYYEMQVPVTLRYLNTYNTGSIPVIYSFYESEINII